MVQKNIKLRKDEEYITLGVLLKIAGIIDTFLSENVVLVNGEEDNRRGRKLYHGDQIQVLNQTFLID